MSVEGTSRPKHAVVIVNYGSSGLLLRNHSHTKGTSDRLVIIVDNFSSTDEQGRVVDLANLFGWFVELMPTNVGFGAGVNAGAARAVREGAQSIVVVNPDAHLRSSDIDALVDEVVADHELMVSPVIRRSDGAVWFDGIDLFLDSGRMASKRRSRPPSGSRRPWLSGACFAISAHLWERVGGFDSDYFLYWEDVDLSHRVLDIGGKLSVLERASAVHDEGGTHPSRPDVHGRSSLYYYFNIRNRLVYAAKHLDDRRLTSWKWQTARVSYEIVRGGGRRQFLRPWRLVRAYLRGIKDGFSYVRSARGR
ncbi:glycosyltransferase family 2 protein [Glaciibacter flavus]|uniref:Glycosyltransferase family 2 protein n=1 Tax=Orlajensenia flava TaxID=2565934 RepID=A0A4V3WST0_9MICO|nr:glycosyltransferase family 2 protein [Glaciibacter flavus]